MAKVILKDIVKQYPKLVEPTVKKINLEIHDKEFMVLVGPSGCGKSTVLRMIAGLENITAGELLIGDTIVNKIPPKDRNIALVFQNYALFPHLTVYENIGFGLQIRKTPKAEANTRIMEAAGILGLETLLKKRPKELSGGQAQRVALGRAIVRNPSVFLFDEPLSNLDAKLRVQMRTEINRLHKRLQTTMIYVTHDQVEAMTMGDRITILYNGDIQQTDTPEKVYNEPTNIFVAGFIGSPAMNFFKGTLEKEGEIYILKNEFLKFSLDTDIAKKYENYIGKQVTLGIRPEDIYCKSKNPSDVTPTQDCISAKIDVIEALGSEFCVYLKISDQNFTAKLKNMYSAKIDDTIELVFNKDKIHFFDENNNRIS